MVYRIVAVPVTLSDLQCHSLTASLLKCDFLYSWAAADKILTVRGVARSLCDS